MSIDEIVRSIVEDPSVEKHDWSFIKSIADAKQYVEEHYNGFTRQQIIKDGPGRKLYRFLQRQDWLDALPPKVIMDWSGLDTPQKAKAFYDEHFKDMDLGQILKKAGGAKFYEFLTRHNWVDELFPEHGDRWAWMNTAELAKGYYDKHFKGMSRSAVLVSRVKYAYSFYMNVMSKGWLDEVIPSKEIDWSKFKTPDAAKVFYEENFKGMSTHALRESPDTSANRFMGFLTRKGWVSSVIPKKYQDWSWMKTPEDAQKHYTEHYKGKSRGEVKGTDDGAVFYIIVRQKGWLDLVMPKKRNSYTTIKTPEEAKKYYEKNYPGLSRHQIIKKASGFYNFLLDNKWQDQVLPKNVGIDWNFLSTVEVAKKYYKNNFQGMDRGRLLKDDTGRKFYDALRIRGWLKDVLPPCKRAYIFDYSGIKTLDDAIAYYNIHFPGKTRMQLYRARRQFYILLGQRGWREQVIPERYKRR